MGRLNQKGSLIIWLSLTFALVGTFIGFALDFGHAYLEKARIARLIDGAAIAAAKVLKGQAGLENDATRAACDSMTMNGAKVVMNGNACTAVQGAPLTATISFIDLPVAGGPSVRAVRVSASEPVPTTFLRFLGWMVPGDYSTISVNAVAEAGPERPVDLMLVLDRSGSMTATSGSGQSKINDLKTAVNGFLGLANTFSAKDRIGMVSFAYRGCGNASGGDSTANTCVPDAALDYATSTHINTLQNKVNALVATGGTNTMEALRTASAALAPSFDDATRSTTRKAVLFVTDGQPTYMRLDNATGCQSNPRTGGTLPSPGDTGGQTQGCVIGVATWTSGASRPYIRRRDLGLTTVDDIPSSLNNASLFRDLIRCTRSWANCAVTNGAMFEANRIRNCGRNNSACNGGSADHDVVFFAIAIGRDTSTTDPQSSLDANAKCMLARMANATDILNAGTGVVQTMNTVCGNVFTTAAVDGDTHADLLEAWPCGSGPCIDSSQQKGKVYTIDVTGNVEAQLQQVFNEIAAILKLRLIL